MKRTWGVKFHYRSTWRKPARSGMDRQPNSLTNNVAIPGSAVVRGECFDHYTSPTSQSHIYNVEKLCKITQYPKSPWLRVYKVYWQYSFLWNYHSKNKHLQLCPQAIEAQFVSYNLIHCWNQNNIDYFLSVTTRKSSDAQHSLIQTINKYYRYWVMFNMQNLGFKGWDNARYKVHFVNRWYCYRVFHR